MAAESNLTTLSPLTGILLPNKNHLELPQSRHIPTLYIVPYGALNIGVVLLNSICLFVFARKHSLRVRNSNLLLMSLATSDLLVGSTSLYYLINLVITSLDDFTRRISTLILGFALETSMLCLASLTYERLIAIWKPLEYKAIFTRHRVHTAITVTWVFSISTSIVRGLLAFCFKDVRYFTVNRMIFIILPTLVSVFLLSVYGYLFYEIHRHSKKIKSQTVSSASVTLDNLDTHHNSNNHDDSKSKVEETSDSLVGRANAISPRHISREKRSLILCCLVVVVFVACWTPVVVFLSGKLLDKHYLSQDYLLYLSTVLISLNAFLDPCLYFVIRRDFRRAAAPILKCRCRF